MFQLYMDHVFFALSYVDGHLGCFRALAIINRAAIIFFNTYGYKIIKWTFLIVLLVYVLTIFSIKKIDNFTGILLYVICCFSPVAFSIFLCI